MKKNLNFMLLLWWSVVCFTACSTNDINTVGSDASGEFALRNELVEVSVNKAGELVTLKNLSTGHNYASGNYLWRMYYDTHEFREREIKGSEQTPTITCDGNSIVLNYDKLVCRGNTLDMQLKLTITLDGENVRFASEMKNNVAHSIIRELHYPLVHDIKYPADHKLILSYEGGRIYDDPQKIIIKVSSAGYPNSAGYMNPDQYFRQFDMHYGAGMASMNCYMLSGENQGLYVGSHDELIQDTWHLLRVYADESGKHTIPSFGLSKYPHCFAGEKWSNDTNILSPYSGTWHKAADKYGNWVRATWWDRREKPQWIKEMKSWQRIIFKHQYGEYFFKYSDLYGRIQDVGESVGADAVMAFGWWKEGMDNNYPTYSEDDSQGGDKAWREAIAKFKESGQKLVMYYNGRMIDADSEYYKSGKGSKISYKNPSGLEYVDQYRFSNHGTYTKEYQSVSFVMADPRSKEWSNILKQFAMRAYKNGANAVFYDQLGKGLRQILPWDNSREFPVPCTRLIYHNAMLLKGIHEYLDKNCDPEFGLGTEWLADYTSMYTDFIHIVKNTSGKENFSELFRYTFPEIKFSDRRIRDDYNIEPRVNLTLLKGLCNDIEIYRCRDLIDKTPTYQAYLAKVNAIREQYKECIVLGTFRDALGFENSNKEVQAKGFWGENKMVVVATNEFNEEVLTTSISVPGYRFVESSTLGNGKVLAGGKKVKLGKCDVAVLLFEKE